MLPFASVGGTNKILGLDVIRRGVRFVIPVFVSTGFQRSTRKKPIENSGGSIFGLSIVTSIQRLKQFKS